MTATPTIQMCPDCGTWHFGKGLCAGCRATVRRTPYAETQSSAPAVIGFGTAILLGSVILAIALVMSTCQ